ncbi:Hsp20/alpha crystallin family protein [Candidatus Campbellbacteria bacterium]|nr:MAG: Hsp20/alpha crystallin family protein [Candidatus Campbellbacteria bacterium]
MKKQSFFQRLTGAINTDDDFLDDDESPKDLMRKDSISTLAEDREQEAELAVDVSQTPTEIIIKTMVAGVGLDDLDVSISQEMVTIKGSRREMYEADDSDYFHRELYWGTFARTILLPAEVKAEDAVAELKNGLLTIRLPKIDKQRQTKLRIRTI